MFLYNKYFLIYRQKRKENHVLKPFLATFTSRYWFSKSQICNHLPFDNVISLTSLVYENTFGDILKIFKWDIFVIWKLIQSMVQLKENSTNLLSKVERGKKRFYLENVAKNIFFGNFWTILGQVLGSWCLGQSETDTGSN